MQVNIVYVDGIGLEIPSFFRVDVNFGECNCGLKIYLLSPKLYHIFEPENWCLENNPSLMREGFQAGAILVSGRVYTLQGINISHLGKRKIIFKMPFLGDMLVPWRVIHINFCWLWTKIKTLKISRLSDTSGKLWATHKTCVSIARSTANGKNASI